MRYFEDRLGALGAGAGAFLALVAAVTLVGQPWAYSDGGAVVGQVVGCLVAVGMGVGLAWVTNQERWRQYREGR